MADPIGTPVEEQMARLSQGQQSLLKGMGVGQPGSMGSLAPQPRPEPVDRFPSLEKTIVAGVMQPKFDVTTQPFGMGIEIKTEVTPRVADPRKISPEITLQQVMNFDNPKIQANFEKAMGVRNAQGEELIFPATMDYATRLDVANKFGTTKIIDDEGGLYDVPWDNLIYKQTRLPDPNQVLSWREQTGEIVREDSPAVPATTLKQVLAKDMTPEQIEAYREAAMLTSLNFIDSDVGKPLFADLINKRLIKAGVEDARTRADIINYAISAPTMDDLQKIGSGIGENALKFPIQMALWGVGEIIDVVDELYLERDLDEYTGYYDIRQSSRRQAIMDTLWQPLAHRMIAKMRQRGTVVPLAVAEEYIATMTGLAPRLVKVTGEIALPSKGAGLLTALRSKGEVARFKQYYAEEIAKGSKRSYDEILDGYRQMRSGVLDGAEPTFVQKMRQMSVSSRLTRGMQLDDAATSMGSRAEVVQAIKYHDNLVKRRDAYYAGIKKRGGTPDAKDTEKLNQLNQSISDALVDIAKTERRSGTPKFMRDIASADKYMVLGAGTTGHFFQQRDETYGVTGDPMMGELVGLGAGLMLHLVKGNVPAAYRALMKSSLAGRFMGKEAQLKFLTQNITNFSPEMQAGIIKRAEYLDEIYDVLIAEGLDPRLLDTGFANLTGLATLKSLQDITSSQLSVKQIRNFSVEDLEANLNLQKQMVAELRGVLQGIEGGIGDTPKGDFFRIVNAAIERGQESIDQLSSDINVINKHGVQYYLDLIDGNSASYGQQLGKDTVKNFGDAMERLQAQNLVNAADVPRPQFNQIAKEAQERVSSTVTKQADSVRSALVTQSQANRAVAGAVGPKGVVASGQRAKANIPSFDGPGDLMAAVLESRHAEDKTVAQRLYGILDSDNFVDGSGNPIKGNVSVNVSDVFDAIFLGQPDLPLGKLRSADMAPGQVAVLDQTFQTLSEPFFATLAEGTDKTVKEVVADLKKTFEAQGKQFRKGISDQTQVVQYMRQAAKEQESTLDIFEMSFTQLRDLDKALRHVQFAARKGGNAERAALFENLENIVEGKFGQFEMVAADGTRTPIDGLGVIVKNDADVNSVMPVGQVLQEANRDWTKFKSRWYDTNEKAVVPRWMSWGDRSAVDVSVNNPLGIRYGAANPREWINVKALGNMDPDVAGKSWFDSLQRTMGREIVDQKTGLPVYTFVEGDKTTEAVASTVKLAVADYIIGLQGRVSPDELARQMNNIDKIFTMRGTDGTVKSMLDINTLIEDTIGFSRKSVGDEIYDRTVQRVVTDIKTQLDKTLEPAQKAKKQKELAIAVLQNYAPGRLSQDQIGEALVSGGIDQLNLVRREIKKAGNFTDEQVSTILSEVYIDHLERRAFKLTGRNVITDASGTTIAESIIDVDAMRDMLGSNDPEKAAIIKSLIGERRYKVWDATAKLMADRAPDYRGRDFDIVGVPRSFSVESLISRVYAINRGVISPRYVGTEAILQQLRNNNYKMIRSVLSDPEIGEMFLEMIRTGKPLTPDKETSFYNAIVASYAKFANTQDKPKPTTMKDKYGRAFTLYPDLETGIPTTARDALVGEGIKIPLFPEVSKRSRDIEQGKAYTTPSIFR